jgi:protein-L-isoaspartate(D-aspartate) O-methyltransferase
MPQSERDLAYEDRPLPIGQGQTISQPYIVAYMTEALQLTGGEKVLEVGTGMGYQAAILGQICSEVYTIDRIPELVEQTARVLEKLNYSNIYCQTGDGTKGWPEHAPFQAILVTAGAPRIAQPLIDQLDIGGRIVAPVGERYYGQEIRRLTKDPAQGLLEERLISVAFVPLIGEFGW